MSLFTAEELRRYPTMAEKALWNHLRAHQCLGFKFRRQHQIGRTIVDFVCLKEKLIVEVDGAVHEKRSAYDQRRDAWLTNQGFRVLRFKNEDVEKHVENVLELIKQVLRKRTSVETN